MKITEMTFEQFAEGKRLDSKAFCGWNNSAITKHQDGKYDICILKSRAWHRNGYITSKWGYFYLDKTGLITQSPTGYGRQYNRKVRIVDIEQSVEKYKNIKFYGGVFNAD